GRRPRCEYLLRHVIAEGSSWGGVRATPAGALSSPPRPASAVPAGGRLRKVVVQPVVQPVLVPAEEATQLAVGPFVVQVRTRTFGRPAAVGGAVTPHHPAVLAGNNQVCVFIDFVRGRQV